ncbi:hypothetical protein ArsFIN_51750 (plasmid) [Arsenophonus nasoniae]|uniref:Lipoprotein n=2 Tax=Arsenophonus nasoniae TaxID=638 RepID=D2U0U2_9GAMM|nr:hypothetical protein ArsFIN_51750 [Arsenophonus nasoniae]CBA74111.1 conserved hypothetical protein [Arsenophonus nasoniae]
MKMKKTKLILLFILLCAGIGAATVEDYSQKQGTKGYTYKDLTAYKQSCPECMSVVNDIIQIRSRVCGQTLSPDDVIVTDALYGYLNSVKHMVGASVYSKVLRLVVAENDCGNSENWANKVQKKIELILN